MAHARQAAMSRVAMCLRGSYVAALNSRRRRTRTRRQSAALNTRTGSVMLPNFEALFGIQHHHRLILLARPRWADPRCLLDPRGGGPKRLRDRPLRELRRSE